MKLLQKESASGKNVPILLLLAVGVIEFVFITLESRFSGIGYYLAETYLIVPCLLFLGYVLREKLSVFAKRRLYLAMAAISWFVIVQIIHRLSGMGNHPMATVFFVYLMAFPFAVLTDDRDNAGLKCIGGTFVAASLVLVFYTLLLLLDRVPAGMAALLFWDGARLNPLWHPNIAASYFMIGIGFCLVFGSQTKKPVVRALLAAAITVQLMAMALTNCRTTLLLTGAMLGGTLFFRIFNGNWKRFVLGLVAAVLVLVGTFKLSGALFQWNNDRLVAQLYQQEDPELSAISLMYQEEAEPEILRLSNVMEAEVAPEEESEILQGNNEQGSLVEDLWSFNGRTQIWESALSAVRDSKALLLWGTEYSGTVISAYHWYEVFHAHNSWLETLMRMGLPGLLMSLVFTVLSVWRAAKLLLTPGTFLWKKIVAMLTMCVMATGFLEPYLFITNVYYHVTDFAFFFLTGYLDYWCKPVPEQEL